MKNLFRIYLNEPLQPFLIPLVLIMCFRIGTIVAASFGGDDSMSSSDLFLNVRLPILLILLAFQNFNDIYRRKEMALLPVSMASKYCSMLLFLLAFYAVTFGAIIIVDLLLNSMLYFICPTALYSPFICLQVIGSLFIHHPADGFFLLLLMSLVNVLIPLITNRQVLSLLFTTAIVWWLFFKMGLLFSEDGGFIESLVNSPYIIPVLALAVVLCLLLGYHCFKRRAVCDSKLLNL